jgi:hypothetical protein
MNKVNPEEKAKEMVSVILKALQKENDPITPLLETYIESELEKYRISQFKFISR